MTLLHGRRPRARAGLVLCGLILLRRMDGPAGLVIATAATLFLTPQVWSHWFIIPAVALLIAAGEWPALRTADAALRRAWQRSEPDGEPRAALQ